MTIHAFTELHNDYPAFVNLSESEPGVFKLTVRSKGNGGRDVGMIALPREQLMNLVNDAAEHLDGEPQQTEKNKAIAASRNFEAEGRRAQILDMALRTPGMTGHEDVLAAATAYHAHITNQPVVKAWTPAMGPDVKQMVDRFLGWKLPDTFYPDCYVIFDRERAQANGSWPVGTNLLTADEARAMFEHVLRNPA
jgi:hypothetical protein